MDTFCAVTSIPVRPVIDISSSRILLQVPDALFSKLFRIKFLKKTTPDEFFRKIRFNTHINYLHSLM